MHPQQPRERIIALPKPWLDAEAALELNRAFYAVEPHEYFNTRLILLMLQAADPDAILAAYKAGLEYGALKRGGPNTTRLEGPEGEAAHTAFVTADAVNLLHHISETAMRFYLAHRPSAKEKHRPCPWLEIVGEVDPVAFKRVVDLRFDDGPLTNARRREIAATFYGSPEPSSGNPEERERLDHSIEEIEVWLQHFARYFVDEAKLYNAMKHGLAVRPGASSMHLETPADAERIARGEKPLIHADGPSVEYLARDGRDDPVKRITRWFRPDVLMAEAQMGVYMIQSIWTIGKLRYVDRDRSQEPALLRFYDKTTLRVVLDAYLGDEPARFVMKTMAVDAGLNYAYPPELKCTQCDRAPREGERHARRHWKALSDGASPLRVICPECVRKHNTGQS